ncbi:hypothetical protein DIPPA_11958 [Diplonema papillatum]|nr:hypothetical protein DIPPA_11958 [Diplonema papillatum]
MTMHTVLPCRLKAPACSTFQPAAAQAARRSVACSEAHAVVTTYLSPRSWRFDSFFPTADSEQKIQGSAEGMQ